MAPVVPPQSHAYVVTGRPKTRAAARVSGTLATFAIVIGFLRTEEAPVVALVGGAAVAGAIAIVLRIFERPRQFTEYRPSRTLGLPVLHASQSPLDKRSGADPD